jgi:hypothetical protein
MLLIYTALENLMGESFCAAYDIPQHMDEHIFHRVDPLDFLQAAEVFDLQRFP